ncbi:hypothetical protein CPB86DRAFT_299459 [Serendipita vermifera]|nr:hypothetical protein CPB86DRAFT_299459 [Serendipita vermifera]
MTTMPSDVSIVVTPPSPSVPHDQPTTGSPLKDNFSAIRTPPSHISQNDEKAIEGYAFSSSLEQTPNTSLPKWRKCAIVGLQWLEQELLVESMVEAAAGVGEYAREQINLMAELQVVQDVGSDVKGIDGCKVAFTDPFYPQSHPPIESRSGIPETIGPLDPSPSQYSGWKETEGHHVSEPSGALCKEPGNVKTANGPSTITLATPNPPDTLGPSLYSGLSRYPPFFCPSTSMPHRRPTDDLTRVHVPPPLLSEFRRMNSEPVIKTLYADDSSSSPPPPSTRTRANSTSAHLSSGAWLSRPAFGSEKPTSAINHRRKPRLIKFPMNFFTSFARTRDDSASATHTSSKGKPLMAQGKIKSIEDEQGAACPSRERNTFLLNVQCISDAQTSIPIADSTPKDADWNSVPSAEVSSPMGFASGIEGPSILDEKSILSNLDNSSLPVLFTSESLASSPYDKTIHHL